MRILFLFATLILMTNCEKGDYVTMVYEETQCSDAWEVNSTSGNSTEEMVINYFKEVHNIDLEDVKVEMVNNGIFCQACTCPSGREIEVNVDEKFVDKMETEKFTRK